LQYGQIRGEWSANITDNRNHLQRFSLSGAVTFEEMGSPPQYFSFPYVWTAQTISTNMFYPQEINGFEYP
jgi:hypothetical protein